MKKIFNFGPILRLSIGIVSLMLALILVFDSFLEILPDERKRQAELHKQLSSLISTQIGGALISGDLRSLQNMVDQLAVSTPKIRSIGVRQNDRTLVVATRDHALQWKPAPGNESTLTHVVVPLFDGKARWGEIELLFADPDGGSLWKWLLQQPGISILLLLSTFGFAGIYLYLRRALNHLDPSHAVPQRVRKAFDTLTEAVIILDPKSQIMLANAVFHQMNSESPERIEGKSIQKIDWLIAGLPQAGNGNVYPWDAVIRSNQTMQGIELHVTLPDGSVHELMMNCSAINDGTGSARGCLVTFDDVTQLSQANAMLQKALIDLQASRDKIQQQNEELQKHAHYDHLTGCFNRRAFFERAEALYEKAVTTGKDITCIMADIDFFKSFNDCYGHSVGDTVIQQVATAMGRSLRTDDLLCRYGGEEFCILLIDAGEHIAQEVAERLRARVDRECGPGVRSIPGLRITTSVGFASLHTASGCQSLTQLIEIADEALYAAKKSGRNRVANSRGEILSRGAPPVPQSVAVPVAANH